MVLSIGHSSVPASKKIFLDVHKSKECEIGSTSSIVRTCPAGLREVGTAREPSLLLRQYIKERHPNIEQV